ncbi:MAG: serine/threonine protein kinase [Deltaproteobacteria bacterium]|nr:serine/threonine protein kinase [Deltaproteobacteria bacterium]
MATLALEPGQVIDREYKVDRLLSQGGMGAVYVCEHLTTGKKRALKVMLPNLVKDPASRERFEREARIGARIESDNVVDVVDAGVDEATGLPFLVMELLDGTDLDGVLEKHGKVPAEAVADICGQLCDALGRGHAIGVVHSDLKPENVFLEKPRRRGIAFTVKVMDFGIAKLVADGQREARVTTPIGSPLWMAPEQTQRGAAITPSTDVWALGLMVYRMLTGVSYWKGANATQEHFNLGNLVLEVVVQPLAPASQRAQEQGVASFLPPGFDAWFERCVVREQDRRFPDAQKAFDALEPVLKPAQGAAARAPPAITPAAPAAPPPALPTARPPLPAPPPAHLPTQVAPGPAWQPAPPTSWQGVGSGPVAPSPQAAAAVKPGWATGGQQVRWPTLGQRVYASVQGGAFQLATVLEVNTVTAMIRIRLDSGGEGWVPAAHLRAGF